MALRRIAGAAILLTLAAGLSFAQQISGSITGVVKDTQDAVITGARVTLIDQATGGTRSTTSGNDGAFVFTPVLPGTYTITIEAPGFKKYEQKDVKVFASDRVTLGDLVLSVGALTETITVEASAVQVSTQGAEKAGILTSRRCWTSP